MDEKNYRFERGKNIYSMLAGILNDLSEEESSLNKYLADKLENQVTIYIKSQVSAGSDGKINGSMKANKFNAFCEEQFDSILNEFYSESLKDQYFDNLEKRITSMYNSFFGLVETVNGFNKKVTKLNMLAEFDVDSDNLKEHRLGNEIFNEFRRKICYAIEDYNARIHDVVHTMGDMDISLSLKPIYETDELNDDFEKCFKVCDDKLNLIETESDAKSIMSNAELLAVSLKELGSFLNLSVYGLKRDSKTDVSDYKSSYNWINRSRVNKKSIFDKLFNVQQTPDHYEEITKSVLEKMSKYTITQKEKWPGNLKINVIEN